MALLAGNAIILYDLSIFEPFRFTAALALTFILPGWAWLPVVRWLHTDRGLERLVLVPGLASLLSSLALLIALLLPGPFTEAPVVIALNLLTLSGLIMQIVRHPDDSPLIRPSRRVLLILLTIMAVAAVTRFTRLGYAEFHEDELENMRLIVRAFKGEEYAPFLDSKGPIHWLLPAALWYLNGWLNEAIARTPMALTSLLLVPMMYVLGRRMSGGRDSVGLLAAGFVALNGFFVAYARHVENQSLIVFWGALGMWLAYRYYREHIPDLLPWLALSLAIGLIAHPDVLLYLPLFGYIIGLKLWADRRQWRRQWLWLTGAGLLMIGLLALFYVPYLTDPNIGLVYQYFGSDRIGTALFYNRVDNIFVQDGMYAGRYHAPTLTLLLLWLLGRTFGRWPRYGLPVFAALTLAMTTTVIWPAGWIIGEVNLAFVPYGLLTLLIILIPQANFETRTLFIWFSVPMWALVFLAKDAADHIQTAYPAWALLAALALRDMWARLDRISAKRTLRAGLAVILILVTGSILFYQYLGFNAPVTTYWQAKANSNNNPQSLIYRIYDNIPRPRKFFSNPRLGGWKAVGYLYETGVLNGDFRSINESFAVPIWYTFQTPRSCYEDPQNYWVRRDWKGWPDEEQIPLDLGYTLTRIVLVDDQPKLHLYEKNAPPQTPEIINLTNYRAKFDRLATPARFARDEPINHPAFLNFGDQLLLRGYNLPNLNAVQPGDLLPVTVYWQALAPMETRYRGFIHLIGPDGKLWGQHDDDPACRLLTTDMRPGQESARQFRLPVATDTPPGQYQLVLGLYHPDSLTRLEIWDNDAAQNRGDSVILGTVTVQ